MNEDLSTRMIAPRLISRPRVLRHLFRILRQAAEIPNVWAVEMMKSSEGDACFPQSIHIKGNCINKRKIWTMEETMDEIAQIGTVDKFGMETSNIIHQRGCRIIPYWVKSQAREFIFS